MASRSLPCNAPIVNINEAAFTDVPAFGTTAPMSDQSKGSALEEKARTPRAGGKSRRRGGFDWIGSPGFAAVVTLLAVLAGAAASLFTEGIRAHGGIAIPDAESGWGAFAFWTLTGIAMLAVVANQRILSDKSEHQRAALSESLAQLDSAVRRLNTLPNEGFLPSFQDSFGEAFALAVMAIAEPKVTPAQVEAAIRAVLAALTDTAKDFDGAAQNTVYSAHVLLFRPRGEAPQTSDALGLPQVTPNHSEYSGALEVIVELSTTSRSPGDIDTGLSCIHLPIPTDGADYFDVATGRMKSRLIPGAPSAFVKGTFDAFTTIDDFMLRLRESSIDRVHVGTIQQYYTQGAGRGVRSFATIPIMDLTAIGQESDEADVGASARSLAVLSLQSEKEGLLADNGATLFAPLAGPFLNVLAILLLRRQEVSPTSRLSSSSPCPSSPAFGVPDEHPPR